MRDPDALCERIYDATIEPELWPSTLDEIASAGKSAWAALLIMRSDSWVGWSVSPSITAELEPYLRSDAAQRSITTERLFAFNHAGFARDQDLFSPAEYRQDVFTKWANSHGFHHGAATGVKLNNGDLAVVQLMRKTKDRAFDCDELRRLDRFRPHLARAAMLAARWKLERLRAAAEALAMIGLPAVVLSGQCRVMAANRLAEHLSDHLTWLAHDGLALVDNAASGKLRQQVLACTVSGSVDSASSFPMWDEARKAPMIVHVVPLKGDRRDLFDGGLALVLFTAAAAPSQPEPDLIRELFDLTAAEARVAAQLAEGRSVEQIADLHSVSLSTIRSQAKSILHKLGAHRQVEIAARLGPIHGFRPPPRAGQH